VSLLLPDATVWVAGGNPARGTYESHMEIYTPQYLLNADGTPATRPTIAGTSSTVIGYGDGFQVHTPDAASIANVVLMRNGAVTHAFDMDQRYVGLSFTAGAGVLNVTGPPDFSLSASPASRSVVQGSGTSFTATVAAGNGFAGSVGLSVRGLPTGATGSFNPASIATSGTSTLNVSTSTSTPTGSYPLTITATSGALTHTANVTLVVSGDFSVSVTPVSLTVLRGSNGSYTVSVTAGAGFTGTVGLSISGLPRRTNGNFSPASITGQGSSKLTVGTNRRSPAGTVTLTSTGTSGVLKHSQQVTLTLR
jgi:hypothetical protein